MARYEHQGGAKATTLASDITAAATSFTVADATGWPTGASYPFWVVIDRGKAAEEKILCTSRTGTLVTVSSRGQDGTSAASHDGGATVEHCLTATEIDKFDAVVEDPAANWTQGNAAYEPLKGTYRGARAYSVSATAVSLANNTETVIPLDSESYDSSGFHDTATNNSRLTIPAGLGGKYLLTGSIQWASNSTGDRRIAFKQNGATFLALSRVPAASTQMWTGLSVEVVLAAGDYVEMFGLQTSGGALAAQGGADYTTWFAAHLIGV